MKLALCLGYFDSVHIGHRELIHLCSEYSAAHQMICSVYTFGEDKTGLFDSIYSFDRRKILLENAGVDLIMSDIFSKKTMKTSGKDFLDGIMSKCNVGAFFCGYDYTFGINASCDADFLLEYARQKDIPCFVMPRFDCDGERVSTTTIKSLLLNGEMEKANRLLGAPFFLIGKVVHGRGEGRSFGYPTANLLYSGFLPKQGVYKTIVEVNGEKHLAVTNVGNKPTFDIDSISIESMLVGFDGDLYGKEITVKFLKYLRPIRKFGSGEELNKQIIKDVQETLC